MKFLRVVCSRLPLNRRYLKETRRLNPRRPALGSGRTAAPPWPAGARMPGSDSALLRR